MLKRILSLACCLSLTVGLFTYRPPEAKAIVTEASLATSVLWSFMQSAGITLNGTGVNSSSWAEAIEPRLQEFTEWIDPKAASFWSWLGYEDGAKGFLKDLVWSAFDGPSTVPGYKIHVPAPVAKKFSDFTSWFAEKVGLTAGSQPVTVASTSGLSDRLFSIYSAYMLEISPNHPVPMSEYHYRLSVYSPSFDYGPYCLFMSDCPLSFVLKTDKFFDGDTTRQPGYYLYTPTDITSGALYFGFVHFSSDLKVTSRSGSSFPSRAGTHYVYFLPLDAEVSLGDAGSSITVSQPGDLAPTYDNSGDKATVLTVPGIEGQVSTINDLLQQILDKLAANDLNSSASLEGEAAPDVPATDIGWKGTIEKIYQGIIDLPGRIAEAIKDLFIPHEGYAAEFVSGLTGAYQGRFGLLTYPFSVLGDFVGTVATLDEQEPILRWNDVKWRDHVVIAKGEYNLKSAIAGTEMQTVYQIYRTVVSAALIVGFLYLCIRKLREVQSH